MSVFKIDRNAPEPLYYQVKQILLKQINHGELKPGEIIMTEKELCEKFQVSRITVRAAIQEMVQEGYLQRRQGVGTFVSQPKLSRGTNSRRSFSEEVSLSGRKPGSKLLELRFESAVGQIAEALGIEEGKKIWVIERLRTIDDEPVAYSTSHLNLPQEIYLHPGELEKEVSLWALLFQKGIIIKETEDTVQAIAANSHQARVLKILQGNPLLLVEGISYDGDGCPIEYSYVYNRADRFKYSVRSTTNQYVSMD
ncbi:MAG: hypothetical protein APF76_06390 [Desulfitibacter sp. BRH_c19]|nr:MAG: hypothetical protein APF76_06390 [Desulfitibacter sp. BRH_c19]